LAVLSRLRPTATPILTDTGTAILRTGTATGILLTLMGMEMHIRTTGTRRTLPVTDTADLTANWHDDRIIGATHM
jgi:hypothetical protein